MIINKLSMQQCKDKNEKKEEEEVANASIYCVLPFRLDTYL